eukprot:1918928-Amphidinium_carterae.1
MLTACLCTECPRQLSRQVHAMRAEKGTSQTQHLCRASWGMACTPSNVSGFVDMQGQEYGFHC